MTPPLTTAIPLPLSAWEGCVMKRPSAMCGPSAHAETSIARYVRGASSGIQKRRGVQR